MDRIELYIKKYDNEIKLRNYSYRNQERYERSIDYLLKHPIKNPLSNHFHNSIHEYIPIALEILYFLTAFKV